MKDTISITINGTEVAGGTLHELKPKDNYTGSYEGHSILAECTRVDKGTLVYAHECTVFIDNERAVQLSF